MSDQRLEIRLNAPGARLDQALAAAEPVYSRVQWQRFIKDGLVTVNGVPTKPSMRLHGDEQVVATLPDIRESELVPEPIPLDILYEDDDLIVINKPAGMVVHPSTSHETGTLVHAVLYHCPDLKGVGGEKRPGIVHRLDKDTSGVIVVAKSDVALRFMQDQFRARTVRKVYLALVDGRVVPTEAEIDAPIGRDPRRRRRMAVIRPGSSAFSREAQTLYSAEIHYDRHTLVRCFPRTGRTHQIRVHLAYIGHPIVGDTVYGRRKPTLRLARQFLHAAALTFRRPADNDVLTISAPLPDDLQTALDKLEAS